MNRKQEKVALITGGSRGIGRAISKKLAQQGVSLAINYLCDHESAQSLVDELTEDGCKAYAIQAHLGRPDSRQELWKKFDEYFDHIDFLIFNAATGVFRQAHTLSINSVHKVFSVNFDALVEFVPAYLQRIPARDDIKAGQVGRIVALSSIGAERVIPDYASVGSSKAAVECFIRQLACELAPKGINCNVVRAGLVDTGLLKYLPGRERVIEETIKKTPAGRLVEPEDVAQVVAFLLSEDSAMINGQTLMVDGGHSLWA